MSYYEKDTGRNHPDEPLAAPSRCPACGSPDVKTTSKSVTAESYWRCVSCGEVWNVARRTESRPAGYGSFRR
jgi:transposase-like protein